LAEKISGFYPVKAAAEPGALSISALCAGIFSRVSRFRKYSFHTLRLAAFVHSSVLMEGGTKERWLELCEQAAVEQDRVKLLQLMQEINRLLEEKEARLAKPRNTKNSIP